MTNHTLIAEAQATAELFDLRVFPVGSDKRPVVKGWRSRATSDPGEIAELFALPGAAGIGVPCGPGNDIMAFDVDFGHTDDPLRTEKLSSWVLRWRDHIDDHARVHRTRSGGLHIIYLWPHGKKPPRRPMPKMEIIGDGFYFIWPSTGSGYEVLQLPSGEWDEPLPEMLEVVEREFHGDGSSLMSADEAHDVMMSDGDAGARHDALLRMTHDWAADYPDARKDELCSGFAEWFTAMYGDAIDAERLSKLLEWRYDQETQELSGELGRAFAGVRSSAVTAAAKLAKAAQRRTQAPVIAAHVAMGRGSAPPPVPEAAADGFLRLYDREESVVLSPWVIRHICREGDLGGFSGVPGLGKTNLTAAIISGLISGDGEAVGLPEIPQPRTVAWINPEEPREALKLRLDAALDTMGLTAQRPVWIAGVDEMVAGNSAFLFRDGRDTRINTGLVELWVNEMRSAGVEVMVLDPITEFNDGNENDRGDRRLLVVALRQIAQRCSGLTTMYFAHTTKTPEGKRDDWYAHDLYAERGSSGAVGSNQFGGTLVREFPPGYKGSDATRWTTESDDPESPTPKILTLRVVKNKLAVHKPTLRWQLTMSENEYGGERMPVAVPISEGEATALISMRAAQNDNLVKVPMARKMIEVMGEGVHTSFAHLHDYMLKSECTGWPKTQTLRVDKGEGARIIQLWRKPLTLTMGGDQWTVSIVTADAGSKRERFALTIKRDAITGGET